MNDMLVQKLVRMHVKNVLNVIFKMLQPKTATPN